METSKIRIRKGILLLSGGFDSVVAGNMLRKKLEIIAIHFHQKELTGEGEVAKIKKLVKKLGIKKVYIVPFVDVFKALVEKCDHRYYYVLSKIAMFKAAEVIAEKEKAKVLITGENLAQVSSQTLSNMRSIDSQVKKIILRPLLTKDKQEIVNIAREIGTYEISKGPEICSLLGPKNPITKSTIEKVEKELNWIDLDSLIKEKLEKAEVISL